VILLVSVRVAFHGYDQQRAAQGDSLSFFFFGESSIANQPGAYRSTQKIAIGKVMDSSFYMMISGRGREEKMASRLISLVSNILFFFSFYSFSLLLPYVLVRKVFFSLFILTQPLFQFSSWAAIMSPARSR
jgi:hypothetical protein